MLSQLTSVSQSVDLICRFSTITLASCEELSARQHASADEWDGRKGQKPHPGLSQALSVNPQEERLKTTMPEVLMSSLASLETARADIDQASRQQIESGRLLQKQATECLRLLADALGEITAPA